MRYFFSATFGTPYNFHGSIEYSNSTKKTEEENKESIIEKCRYEMVKHFERWGVASKDITRFEVYYMENTNDEKFIDVYKKNAQAITKEVTIFKWEK